MIRKILLAVLAMAAWVWGEWVTAMTPKILAPLVHDSKFRFTTIADPQVHDTKDIYDLAYLKAVENCREIKPNALLNLGDIGDNTLWRTMAALLRCNYSLTTNIIAFGNHDEEEITYGLGTTNAVDIAKNLRYGPPFWLTKTLLSGDSTKQIRIFQLDFAFVNDTNCTWHEQGDRVGYSAEGNVFLMFKRQLGPEQLSWITSMLSSDTISDGIVFCGHYPPGSQWTDSKSLGDIIKNDGRPTIGFCGHSHIGGTTYKVYTTDSSKYYNWHKPPTLYNSMSWTNYTFSLADSGFVFDTAIVKNYDPACGYENEAIYTIE